MNFTQQLRRHFLIRYGSGDESISQGKDQRATAVAVRYGGGVAPKADAAAVRRRCDHREGRLRESCDGEKPSTNKTTNKRTDDAGFVHS